MEDKKYLDKDVEILNEYVSGKDALLKDLDDPFIEFYLEGKKFIKNIKTGCIEWDMEEDDRTCRKTFKLLKRYELWGRK